MNNDELTTKYKALLGDPFEVLKVEHCNHKPHPFMIGSAHVAHAADHHGGMLGEATLSAIGCYWKDDTYGRCGLPYHQHTSDRVLFVKVIRNCANKDAADALFAIKEMMVTDRIDGVAFVESGFRIAPPVQEGSEDPTIDGLQ